jgi:hypothetical protein
VRLAHWQSRSRHQKRLRAVVHALPETGRRCLFLGAEGLGYRKIAEILVARAAER